MNRLLPLLFLCATSNVFAQFSIGHRSITYNDPARSNRAIACEVYYPGVSTGDDVAVANGEFPLVVLGHGFSMTVGAYQNWWEEFVPDGYIFVLPTTEGGLFTVSHGDFGLDIAFVADQMQAANSDNGSPFFGKVKPRTALMGHSMGGGATILAAANNTSIDCIVGLAPAETNPSAAAAGANVSVPALILHGTEDQVTPEADHALLIYNGLTSSCKYYARLDEGAHCFFANYNFFCATGEMNIGTLTREQQQALSYTIVSPWLEYFLKDVCPSYGMFTDEFNTNAQLGPNLESCSNDAPVISENNGTLESDAQNNYQWYLDGNEIPNADQQTYAYSQSGTYQVGTVTLGNCPSLSNEIAVQVTGIVEAEIGIQIFGNDVRLRTRDQLQNVAIEWFDLSGRLIDAKTISSVASNGIISLSKPTFEGVKLLRLRSDEASKVWKVY
ncbi:MAG: dienelactone hydrolase family protein [Flavobacteriales bacterium]|nr:dienelactone hydrolase family protein [Flavobacteriales bacterium]